MRLQLLLFLAFILVAAIPVIILDFWESRIAVQRDMNSIQDRHLLVARTLASSLSQYAREIKTAFKVSLTGGALVRDQPGLIELLASLDFIQVMVVRPDGTIEGAIADPAQPTPWTASPKILAELQALATPRDREPRLSGVRHDASGAPVVYLVMNLPGDRLAVGVVSTRYLRKLQLAVAFGGHGHAVITDPVGLTIAHPNREWVAAARNLSDIPAVQAMRRGETGVAEFVTPFSENSPFSQQRMVAGYAVVPESGWGVMVSQPIDELTQNAREIDRHASIVAAAAFAFAALLSLGLAYLLARPIRQIAATADAILAGDETAKVQAFSGMVPQEIRRLGRAFNLMVTGLQRRNAEARQAKEQADIANRAKSQFLANMSHEIRTPLNGMLGMTELLAKTELTQAQRRYTDAMAQSGNLLIGLINDVLDLSKIEAGMLTLEKGPLLLAKLAHDAASLFAEPARAKGLELRVHVAHELHAKLVGDAHRLQQILINLLGNAVKFTREGSVGLNVSIAEDTGAALRVVFEVHDTGIGIPANKLALIFDAFTQADGSTTREYGGTGLGLSIARQIAIAMGGSLSVDSTPGQGSVFRLSVALRKVRPDGFPGPDGFPNAASAPEPAGAARQPGNIALSGPPASPIEPPPANPKPGKPPPLRVLLVEDNRMNMEVARALMEQLGCEVTTAADGQEAAAAYAAGTFDLVFMDLQMPRMDGFQATSAIRAHQRKSGIWAPIIACSAHALPGDREKSLAGGMDEHVTKPITGAVLRSAIATWVREADHGVLA